MTNASRRLTLPIKFAVEGHRFSFFSYSPTHLLTYSPLGKSSGASLLQEGCLR
jgi:hypothetical protein